MDNLQKVLAFVEARITELEREGKGGCLVVGSKETISPVNKIARSVLLNPLW